MKPETQQLTLREETAPAVRNEPSVALMLQAMIEKGVTSENVSALEQLMQLHERMEQRENVRAFNAAFAAMQSELPQIEKDKDAGGRFKYAPFEHIMRKVQPVLQRHGFSVSFDAAFDDKRVTVTCKLRHASGHSETNNFAARIGKGPPASSEAQGDGAAMTYAKRFALCAALNIVVQDEGDLDDAREQGEAITPSQAADLRERVIACGANEKQFLQFAGAPRYEEIPASALDRIDKMLTKKERGQ